MKQLKNPFLQGVAALMFSPALFSAGLDGVALQPGVSDSMFLGVLAASLNGALCFSVLHWSFRKPDRVFYSGFFGGMAWKAAVLAAALLIAPRFPSLRPAAFLVSFGVATFLVNLVELRFLPRA